MVRGLGCSKSRLATVAGAEAAVQQKHEKRHAAVARSTFSSQNVQSTSASEPFWTIRSRKVAHRCGAKYMCQSKCAKHLIAGSILQVHIGKNGTQLWREAHL